MRTKGKATLEFEVEVNTVLKDTMEYMFGRRGRIKDLCIKDGKLVKETDISYHGSPYYETEIISEDGNDIKAYESLKFLIEYTKTKDRI